ncbi:MAG: hypothetical protein NTW28_04470 [Candidatus Solibacter sp.]|nr:hypothetical protein [Candidatus Solibacter sp.]
MLLLATLIALSQDAAQPGLSDLLSRVAEEAEVLQQNAPKSLTLEILEQRALKPATRFRPRLGKAATVPQPPRLVVRQIISEYSVGALKESAVQNLTELRQVISVDGRRVQSAERARHALSLGITSPDDRVRKRMLEDFASHGLVDIATDYGIFLLAFSKRGLENMKVAISGEEPVGADPAWVLTWQQTSPDGGVLEFLGNQASRRALQGRLLVRKSDGLPLRIHAWSEHSQAGHTIRDEATVDYVQSPHGFLTPASVVHRHMVDGQVITENLYRYEPFKMFSADAEIKFTELETPPQPPPPIKK